ncbi:MAG: SPFH domain-containing protein [Gemmataceae bacterium]
MSCRPTYVVHTRRGHAEPLHLGPGVSFRFDPSTDAFLLIPAAVQTLLINARCISVERQGILVQAYVQWVVDDLRTAYRKLDFSDPEDPMRIVNVQLREQAEAAVKDKVATMPIDAILSDKQPIIEELTHRLRGVAEGSRDNGSTTGLGLKIVTVQIKEAVVSSTRLWENLQSRSAPSERSWPASPSWRRPNSWLAASWPSGRPARRPRPRRSAARRAARRQAKQAYDRDQAETARRLAVEQEAERGAGAAPPRSAASGRRGAGGAAGTAGRRRTRPRAGDAAAADRAGAAARRAGDAADVTRRRP